VVPPHPLIEYHALLEDGDLAAESAVALSEGQRARRLVFGDRPLCVALRPNLISRWQYDAITTASETLYAAFDRLERALLGDDDLRLELDLDPQEAALAIADPGFRASSPSARLDGFVGDDGVIRFVEYNAESPAGMAYNDELSAVFATLPVMKAFKKRHTLGAFPVRGKQLGVLRRAHRPRGELRTIAIVDWRGLPTLTEFEMFKSYFEQQGLKAIICAPQDLTYSRKALRANGTRIDVVYRRVLTSELLAKPDVAKALVQAYMDGAVTVVNSFRAKLLHKKMSLALLSDDRYAKLYTPEQRKAIATHIPWTRKMREGHTTYRGKVVDLVDLVSKRKDRFVLKPNDEYGGKGVILGWTVEQHEWEQTILTGLTASYVVQEKVSVPRYPFPVLLFWGRVTGCLTRLSAAALLNVTAGAGSVVPTYIVES